MKFIIYIGCFLVLAVQFSNCLLDKKLSDIVDGYLSSAKVTTTLSNKNSHQDESQLIHKQAVAMLRANGMLRLSNVSLADQKLLRLSYKASEEYCPEKNYKCNEDYHYRTISGVCNNLYIPWWGKAFTPYGRILKHEYDDGYNSPRTRSVSGGYLPNPRQIAIDIHHSRRTHPETSHFLIFFHQFVNHDLIQTAKVRDNYGDELSCGQRCYNDDPDCYNIPIPQGDYVNHDQDCIHFSRSAASVYDCNLSHREQLNEVTSWLDMSQIYGSNERLAKELRTHENGYLKTSTNPIDGYPTLPVTDDCLPMMKDNLCYLSGDKRNNQNRYISMISKLAVTEHNRIARVLYDLNPHWDDEYLYQEARNINIAQYQHVIYWDMLPLLLGSHAMKKWDLIASKYDYFTGYDQHIDPAIKNAFVLASRCGHTLVNRDHYGFNDDYDLAYNKTTDYIMFHNTYYDNVVIKGACMQNSYFSTPQVNTVLNDYLFEGYSKYSKRSSLAALNIQRGRDHGLPSYNKYRAWCGLNYAYSFDELSNIPQSVRNELSYIYKDVDDMDLFTGLMSEYAVEDGVVGHTTACILAAGFRDWKFGDRYYYANKKEYGIGFTLDQLHEIRKASLARTLCDNSDIRFVQRNPFLIANKYENELVDCDDIDRVSLLPFQEHRE